MKKTERDADEVSTDDKVPQVDVDLKSAESILSDYISLMRLNRRSRRKRRIGRRLPIRACAAVPHI